MAIDGLQVHHVTRAAAFIPDRVRALSFHADYACGNSGACCSAGWPIPVELHVLPALTRALSDKVVAPVGSDPPLTFPAERPATMGAELGRDSRGRCVFFDPSQPRGSCRVQRHAGVSAMPTACRQFPRIARHDARGTDVSLSHWCPTALGCLERDVAVTIVEQPAAFVGAQSFEGLDARHTWPPLLRPDCLIDADAYEALERLTVDILTSEGPPIDARLAALHRWFEYLRGWRPARGPLLDDILASRPDIDAQGTCGTPEQDERIWRTVVTAIPEDLRTRMPDGLAPPAHDAETVWRLPCQSQRIGRYLAARFFGSWVAYQGRGLRSTIASLFAARAVVRRALACDMDAAPAVRVRTAIRTADLLLLHLASPEALARHYSRWET